MTKRTVQIDRAENGWIVVVQTPVDPRKAQYDTMRDVMELAKSSIEAGVTPPFPIQTPDDASTKPSEVYVFGDIEKVMAFVREAVA